MDFLALLILLPTAFEFNPPGGLAGAMQAGAAVYEPADAAVRNPALISGLDRSSVSLTFTQPYGLDGLSYSRLELCLPRPGLGAQLSLLNYPGYQEFTGTLTKGFDLGRGFGFGAAVSFYALSINREVFDIVPGLSAGGAWRSKYISLGAALANFNRPALSNGDPVPATVFVGTCVTPYSSLRLAADFDYSGQAQLRFGSAFDVSPWLSLAAGLRTNPLLCSGGLRASTHGLNLSYTYSFQPRLKESHILGLGFSF